MKFLVRFSRHAHTETQWASQNTGRLLIVAYQQYWLSLCFPCAAYEIRHGLDLALLTNQNGRYFYKTHLATLFTSVELIQVVLKNIKSKRGKMREEEVAAKSRNIQVTVKSSGDILRKL